LWQRKRFCRQVGDLEEAQINEQTKKLLGVDSYSLGRMHSIIFVFGSDSINIVNEDSDENEPRHDIQNVPRRIEWLGVTVNVIFAA
jgi:hypothetical protein